MTALAVDCQFKLIRVRCYSTRFNMNFTERFRRHNMLRKDDIQVIEQTRRYHLLRTARRQFFCMLEYKINFTVNFILVVREHFCSTEQHSRMRIVSARMHLAVYFRYEIQIVTVFLNRQCVDISPESNLTSRMVSFNNPEHT